MELISQRKYARLRGVTHRAVQKAVAEGRIPAHHGGKICAAEADAAWERNTDPTKPKGTATARLAARPPRQPGQGSATTPAEAGHAAGAAAAAGGDGLDTDLSGSTLAEARTVSERFKALTARLEYEQKLGRLVDAEQVAREWERIIGVSRTKVLALPSKIRTRLPKLDAEDVATIEQLVRETLEELAEGDSGRA